MSQPTISKPSIPLTPFCGDLRSKAFFLLDQIPTRAEQYLGNDEHCWCAQTEQVVGPDEQIVEPHRCVPGRSCYRSALAARSAI